MGLVPAIQDLLLGSGPVTPAADNLPSASIVEGNFVTARRAEGTLLEFFAYLGMMVTVRALDENTISVTIGALATATYRQVEPYVFRIVSRGSLLNMFGDEIHFIMDNDRPVHVAVGNGFDLTPLPPGRGTFVLTGSLAIVVGSAVFFLLAPVIMLIMFLRKKEKHIPKFHLLGNGLLFCGTLLVLNNLICLMRGHSQMFRSFAEIAPHVWANYALLIFAVLLTSASVVFLAGKRMRISKKRKAFYAITTILMALLFVVLHNWNFSHFDQNRQKRFSFYHRALPPDGND